MFARAYTVEALRIRSCWEWPHDRNSGNICGKICIKTPISQKFAVLIEKKTWRASSNQPQQAKNRVHNVEAMDGACLALDNLKHHKA